MSAIFPPDSWAGRLVPTLEVMGFVRDQILAGFALELFIGKSDAYLFGAFADGVHFHLFCCGHDDAGWMAFIDWLRDVRGEFPSTDGWQKKYLADAKGDHRAAIMKFLDRCAEFSACSKAS